MQRFVFKDNNPFYQGHANCGVLFHRFDDSGDGHTLHAHLVGNVGNFSIWTCLHDGSILPDDASAGKIESAVFFEEIRPCDIAGVLYGFK